jgi:catechol 2,3-dioxygenase-like lactoylglutathione lyase family enzyme
MAIELDHMIVPAHDPEESARFYERIFGFRYEGAMGPFKQVRIPDQGLTLDFDAWREFEPSHYAFKVGEAEFDAIFSRIVKAGLAYGSEPGAPDNGATNQWNGGRGLYFRDPSGHLLELLTRGYAVGPAPQR